MLESASRSQVAAWWLDEIDALDLDPSEWDAPEWSTWSDVAAVPSLDTLDILLAADPAELEPADAVTVLQGLERASAWLSAVTMRWVSAVADVADAAVARGEALHGEHPDGLDAGEAEVAAALACSSGTARRRVELARAMCGPLQAARELMLLGGLTYTHALVLQEATQELAPRLAEIVSGRVAGKAPHRSPAQFGRIVRREVTRIDPVGPEVRRADAVARRAVTLTPLPDGMALFSAVLPAETARAIYDTLTAAARAAQAHDGRLNALLDALRRQAESLAPAVEPAGAARDLLLAAARASLNCPEARADRIAAESLDRLRADLLAALVLGVPAHADAPALGESSAGTAGRRPQGTSAGGQDQQPAELLWRVLSAGPIVPPAEVQVVVDLATLLGLQDEPAHLRGYGPVPPAVARVLATSSPWRRFVADPLTGALLDRSPRRYRPGADLIGFVRARGDHCRFAGCQRPAHQCDIDHAVPFDPANPAEGGQTVPGNLGCLCRRHHRLKTHGGWRVTHGDDGTSRWTSVLGVRYTVPPDDLLSRPPSGRQRR